MWLVSQWDPVRREATAKASRSAPFPAWVLVRWAWPTAHVSIPTPHARTPSLPSVFCCRKSYCLAPSSPACNPYEAAFQWGWGDLPAALQKVQWPRNTLNLEPKLTSKDFCCCVWCIQQTSNHRGNFCGCLSCLLLMPACWRPDNIINSRKVICIS